jgi:nitroreductase
MDVFEAVMKRRTVRRFTQESVPVDVLKKLIEGARVAPSGANLQPLKYIVCTNPVKNGEIFDCLKWAGYIAPAGNPPEGERPTAYVIVLVDKDIVPNGGERDVGAAVENILLGAVEESLGSCWICSVDTDRLRKALNIAAKYVIDTVVALGYPNESPQIIDMQDSVRYYKNENGRLHVPKRVMDSILEVVE